MHAGGLSGGVGEGPRAAVDFLTCPPASLLEDFAGRPNDLDVRLVKSVSRHLGRCAACRVDVEGWRHANETPGSRRLWIWAAAAAGAMFLVAFLFVRREMAFSDVQPAARPDSRLASLARFDRPGPAAFSSPRAGRGRSVGALDPDPLSGEDERELGAARASIEGERYADAAGLLEDLLARHPHRTGLRLVLAYVYASQGEYEKARRQYSLSHEQEMSVETCWGLANAHLRLGDIAGARRELIGHVLLRHPDDVNARNLLSRIGIADASIP